MKKIFKSLVFILVVIYAGMTLINQQKKINAYETNIEYLSDQIKEKTEYNTELMATKDNINSDEYIEQIAREKLNMYKQNETVYVDIDK
jgi:cell division protein FtsB